MISRENSSIKMIYAITDFKLEEQYDAQGRISSASFRHAGEDKSFGFEYLAGTHLRSRLNMPNGMNVRHLYEANRNLVSHINDYRGDTGVSLKEYTYDALNRPATRKYSRQGSVRNDVLSYNSRNELVDATLGADAYAYDFDNIGNRKSAAEQGQDWSYLSNELNQYARITQDGTPPLESVIFTPQYDSDGNQTLLETQTGIWSVTYDAFNRPIRFTSQDEIIIIESNYDSMGRRVNKKVTQNGVVSLHQRYLYRGYLQIACIDMTRSGLNGMWMITWDPTQASATRPLALQKDGTWYCYGTDLSKNVTEVYKNNGTIATAYTYAPFGQVVASGSTTQPLQWSSEYYDTELGLVYYNYRHYNPKDGRWINRDPIGMEGGYNLYAYVGNSAEWQWDILGEKVSLGRPSISAGGVGNAADAAVEIAGAVGVMTSKNPGQIFRECLQLCNQALVKSKKKCGCCSCLYHVREGGAWGNVKVLSYSLCQAKITIGFSCEYMSKNAAYYGVNILFENEDPDVKRYPKCASVPDPFTGKCMGKPGDYMSIYNFV